ncbi:hypothetical protein [Fuchsiella alkaliacetigena]|uniref:hypothetical protein n=1 Tax=Fuchsiella alkaliacetigena TaxID=957042 RepID=UPI00200A1BC0|nr:hypothetical protein [Fuchsiella alkaliacetigena]MCK8824113.1 hypothetical protein [Fuchsiella alkaliacetigena]
MDHKHLEEREKLLKNSSQSEAEAEVELSSVAEETAALESKEDQASCSSCTNLKGMVYQLRTFANDIDKLVSAVESIAPLVAEEADVSSAAELDSDTIQKLDIESLLSQSEDLDKPTLDNLLMQVVIKSLLEQLTNNLD